MIQTITVAIIAILTYYFIIFNRKISNSIITFFLATLLFIVKPISGLEFENVGKIISFETLGILLGMMIIVEVLKESGFFTFTAVGVIKISRYKFWTVIFLLMIVVVMFSAFLDNLVTIMLMAPIIFLIADTIEIDPTPLLMFTIVIDNIGGMSTLIGSPLNIVLSSIGKLDFNNFLFTMFPITIITFASSFLVFKFSNKFDTKTFNKKLEKLSEMDISKTIQNKSVMIKGLVIFILVLSGFIFHSVLNIDLALIAIFGALLLMLLINKNFEAMAKQIDWDTMFFYAGLFIVSYALEEIGLTEFIAGFFEPLIATPLILLIVIMWVGAFSIPFLSAVPGTLILAPVIKMLITAGAPFELWYAFAIGANLGTNLTPLGAVQNLVGVALIKKQTGREISFGKYMKVSMKSVLISLVLGTGYLIFHYYVLVK